MTWEELKRKYGIHVIKNESPNTGGPLVVEGIECFNHFSVWSDGKISAGTGFPARNNKFHVSGATWTVVEDYYWCKWEPGYIRVTLYTKMTSPDIIDAFLEKAPRRGINENSSPIADKGWWGDIKK